MTRPVPDVRTSSGFVLLTVLVIVLLASMVAASLIFALQADVTALGAGVQQEQSWNVALSGVARAVAIARAAPSGAIPWAENAEAFQHQLVADDGSDRWYFTIYSASDAISADLRFGLTDEAGKLPLLHADPTWLERLPGLDATVVQQLVPILEAINAASAAPAVAPAPRSDSSTNEFGIPALPLDAFEGFDTNRASAVASDPASPSAPSLEEIFARAGVDLALLFGEDTNFNLRLDANEDDGDAEWPFDDRNGLLDAGLQRYLTVDSYDLNVDADGHPRINLNDPDADLSSLGLPAATMEYLAAMRRAKKTLGHPVELLGAEESFPDAAGKNARLKSGVGPDELPLVLDRCTTTNAMRLEGLVNLDTAPAPVLAALPGVGESGADAIVAARAGLGWDERRTPAWILRRGIVTADQFKDLAPHLTSRGFQYSFRCIGYAIPSGRYRVLGAVIDVATRPPRVTALRDLTKLGFPVPLESLQASGL